MTDIFENPMVLLALLAIVPFAIWDIARRWASGRRRQMLSVAIRVVLIAAAIVALAKPRSVVTEEVADVVFVLDRSSSIPDHLLLRALDQIDVLRRGLESHERASLVFFDQTPEVAVYPGDSWLQPPLTRPAPVDQTDIGTALQVALGLIPDAHAGRIVLLTDAQHTQGNLRRALSVASDRGIAVSTIAIDSIFSDPAVADITLDQDRAHAGETISGSVLVRGGPEISTGQLRVFVGDDEAELSLERSIVTIPAGETLRIPFEHSLSTEREAGLTSVRAEFTPLTHDDVARIGDASLTDLVSDDPVLANNQMTVGLNVVGPPDVLIVAHDIHHVDDLERTLTAEEMNTRRISTQELLEEPELAFADYDLVILANVPALPTEDGEAALGDARSAELRRYVSSGGGLITLGGDRTYELGGYGNTELADVLPIDLQPRDPEIEPAVTMIIILDNSGSMGAWAEGDTKMDLADSAAVAAMRLLRDFDFLGVMAVDDRVDWVLPVQPVADRGQLERAIRGIQAGGGGIYVYTSLREAWRHMRHADTPLRHVILFTDSDDSEEQVAGVIFGWGPGPNSYDLARSMRAEGITTSVIGIGTEYDQDTAFLRNLADAGGGRFYLTSRASELEGLFVEETQRVVDSALTEEPFRVRSRGEHPAVEGIEFRRSPRLLGYIELEPQDTAEVSLTHPDGHPVMTSWQYGLGQVAAMAIDAGPTWSERWLEWDGYSLFWTQLTRWALRRHEGDDTALEVTYSDGLATLNVARRSVEGLTEIDGGLQALMQQTDERGDPVGHAVPVELSILEPGLWEAALETDPGLRYNIEIRDADDEVFASQSFVSPPSAEFRAEGADHELLGDIASLTEGFVDPEPAQLEIAPSVFTSHQPLWLYCLLAALLLLPIDAYLRRPARDAT